MKKIISLNDPAFNKTGPRKKKNQTERLDEFALSLKNGADIVTEIATSSKTFGAEAAKKCGLDFELFDLDENSCNDFISSFFNHIVSPLNYVYRTENDIVYEICVIVMKPEMGQITGQYAVLKTENNISYSYHFKEEVWDKIQEEQVMPPQTLRALEENGPEIRLQQMFLSGGFTMEAYKNFLKKNEPFVKLFGKVYDYVEPHYIESADENGKHKIEFLMFPRDAVKCYGFRVLYDDGEFILQQSLDYMRFVHPSETYWDDPEKDRYQDYCREVGRTRDIEKIADCLCRLADHYFVDETGMIPLSLNSYMKVKNYEPLIYNYICDKNRPLTDSEEEAEDAAVEQLLAYSEEKKNAR